MEKNIKIQEYLDKFLKYYQKISLSVILGKSKKDSTWYCLNMKIIFLRKIDNIEKDFYLINQLNKENIEIKFYEFRIDQVDIVFQALQGKVELDGKPYNFYSNQSPYTSDNYLNIPSDIGDFDSNYEGYGGFTFTKCYFTGTFHSMLNHLLLTETDIGMNECDFPRILNMNSSYFNSNTLYIIFPLFIREIPSTHNYLKKYAIDNNLFDDLKIELYTDKKNLKTFIETKINNSTIIKIPSIIDEKNIIFRLYHYRFGEIIKEKLSDKKYVQKGDSQKPIEDEDKDLDKQSKTPYITYINSLYMGDRFENIQDSTIINKSLNKFFINIFEKLEKEYDKDTRDEFEQVTKLVENSKNKAAISNLIKFLNELDKEKPDKSKLKNLWSRIKEELPPINTIITTANKLLSEILTNI